MGHASNHHQHEFEHGRRYYSRGEGAYDLPDDEVEQERLNLQHLSFKDAIGGRLHLAPLPSGRFKALDVGCGTGIWAAEFAEEHPAADIVGLDIDPTIRSKPAPDNVRFLMGDAESDWTTIFGDEKFDYIHSRALVLIVKDWGRLLQQEYAALNPGGWVELQDWSYAQCSDANGPLDASKSALVKWASLVDSAMVKTGRGLSQIERLETPLRNAGFVDIHARRCLDPIGSWPKDPDLKVRGELGWKNARGYTRSISLALLPKVYGWSIEKVEALLQEIEEEQNHPGDKEIWERMSVFKSFVRNKTNQPSRRVFWYARKPKDGETRAETSAAIIEEGVEPLGEISHYVED